MARCAIDGAAIWWLTGTEIAHWLFCTKNTHGALYTAARFSASCASPSLVAPSPRKATVTESSPSRCAAIAAPTACKSVGADRDRDRGAAFLGESQPAVPLAPPDRAHLRRRDAAHQKGADLAVLGKQPVGLAQAGRRADLGGLLAAARREQRQLALSLQVDEFDVEFAGDDHHLVQPAQRLGWQIPAVAVLGVWASHRGQRVAPARGRRPPTSQIPQPYRLLFGDGMFRRQSARCSARWRSEQTPGEGAAS